MLARLMELGTALRLPFAFAPAFAKASSWRATAIVGPWHRSSMERMHAFVRGQASFA